MAFLTNLVRNLNLNHLVQSQWIGERQHWTEMRHNKLNELLTYAVTLDPLITVDVQLLTYAVMSDPLITVDVQVLTPELKYLCSKTTQSYQDEPNQQL
jgi:hypothetical protein